MLLGYRVADIPRFAQFSDEHRRKLRKAAAARGGVFQKSRQFPGKEKELAEFWDDAYENILNDAQGDALLQSAVQYVDRLDDRSLDNSSRTHETELEPLTVSFLPPKKH